MPRYYLRRAPGAGAYRIKDDKLIVRTRTDEKLEVLPAPKDILKAFLSVNVFTSNKWALAFVEEFGFVFCETHRQESFTSIFRLSNFLNGFVTAANDAGQTLKGEALKQKLTILGTELILAAPIRPTALPKVEISNGGEITVLEMPESLAAHLIRETLLYVTAKSRCLECGTPVPKRNKFCKFHGSRQGLRQRESR